MLGTRLHALAFLEHSTRRRHITGVTDPTTPATNYHPTFSNTPIAVDDPGTRRLLRTRVLGGLVNEYWYAA